MKRGEKLGEIRGEKRGEKRGKICQSHDIILRPGTQRDLDRLERMTDALLTVQSWEELLAIS